MRRDKLCSVAVVGDGRAAKLLVIAQVCLRLKRVCDCGSVKSRGSGRVGDGVLWQFVLRELVREIVPSLPMKASRSHDLGVWTKGPAKMRNTR